MPLNTWLCRANWLDTLRSTIPLCPPPKDWKSIPRDAKLHIAQTLHAASAMVKHVASSLSLSSAWSGSTEMSSSSTPEVQRERRLAPYFRYLGSKLSLAACAIVMYLLCEVLIFTITIALYHGRVEFLSSIVGMVLVFLGMLAVGRIWRGTEERYTEYIQPTVDFINQNLGLAFPIPIVMMDNTISEKVIGLAAGNFFITFLIFWALVLITAWIALAGILRLPAWNRKPRGRAPDAEAARSKEDHGRPARVQTPPPAYRRFRNSCDARESIELKARARAQSTAAPSRSTSAVSVTTLGSSYSRATVSDPAPELSTIPSRAESEPTAVSSPAKPPLIQNYYSVLHALLCLAIIGIPVHYGTRDDRVLDICILWLSWVSAVKLQSTLRRIKFSCSADLHYALVTLLNPVLITTLLLCGYTRAKAHILEVPLNSILATFSSGMSVAQYWSRNLPLNVSHPNNGVEDLKEWFGAGDIALSLLECGIVVWGFKLYECRRQLCSLAGAAVVCVSVASAFGSAFVCVATARLVGLGDVEALSFAARSTTLALSKPSTTALGGSVVINAGAVVSSGIAGQLVAPYLLRFFRVRDNAEKNHPTTSTSTSTNTDEDDSAGDRDEDRDDGEANVKDVGAVSDERDSAVDIATGTTIGINGAAMGVSYLYERRSRAAPYAALSMTAFGVMTTIIASVEPTKGALQWLVGANWA